MASYSDAEYYFMLENLLFSATEQIRNIFKKRFKVETGMDWQDDQESLEKFAKELGQRAYSDCLYYQKALMTSKPVKSWDILLLATVIQNFGNDKKYKKENDAVLALRKMRHELALNKMKKIQKDDYQEKMKVVRVSLKALGMKASDINQLVVQSKEESFLKSLKYVLVLLEKADELLEDGKVDDAANSYNEAVDVPNLMPNALALVLEKRAEFLLNLVKSPAADRNHLEQAFDDIKKSLDLNDVSWVGHHLMAKCLKLKENLPEAIHHYERAIAISPVQKEVDPCNIPTNEDHHIPSVPPTTVGDIVADFKSRTGIRMTEKEVTMNATFGSTKGGSALSILPGYNEDYFRGIQYLFGTGVPQNYVEGVKCLKRAANTKHPEAMYQLACCYYNGHGITKNKEEAIRIYKEVAEMNPKIPVSSAPTQTNSNGGVMSAQHALGQAYETGDGLDVNIQEAVKWYRRAMENGSGASALNLGIIYSEGKGVPVDLKMAELCWKEAVNLNSAPATAKLVVYYTESLEPEKATNYFKIGRQIDYEPLLQLSEEFLIQQLHVVETKRLAAEPDVEKVERFEQLETKGFTFRERVYRMFQYICSKEEADTLAAVGKNKSQCQRSVIRKKTLTSSELKKITELAQEGSQTAQRVMNTLTCEADLEKMLLKKEDAKQFTETEKLEILNLAYKCVTGEWNFVRLSDKAKCHLSQIFSGLIVDKKYDTISEEDMKLRLCCAAVRSMNHCIALISDMSLLEMLKEGLRRYPDNVSYYQYLICILCNEDQLLLSQFYVEEGLKKHPTNLDLLYAHSYGLFNHMYTAESGKIDEGCVEALEKFVSTAPPDNCHLPDVIYMLCNRLLSIAFRATPIPQGTLLERVRDIFKRGQLSEEVQLPCYSLCADVIERKAVLEMVLGRLDGDDTKTGMMMTKPKNTPPKQDVLTRKPYLKAPTRKTAFKLHRESFAELSLEEQLESKLGITSDSSLPKLVQNVPKKMSLVKPISVYEMNPTQDHLYQNRIIQLTVIDEPNNKSGGIFVLAEDDNGDIVRVQVYNLEANKENLAKFSPGCRFSILNPVMEIGIMTRINYLRNDEPKCIRYLQKLENMCRFCGVENAEKKCSKCRRPYCSRECQKLDWKMMNHKLICS